MDIDLDGLRNTRKYKYAYLLSEAFEVFTRDIDDKGQPVSEWEYLYGWINYPEAIKEGLEEVLKAEGKKEFQIRDLETEEVIWI